MLYRTKCHCGAYRETDDKQQAEKKCSWCGGKMYPPRIHKQGKEKEKLERFET